VPPADGTTGVPVTTAIDVTLSAAIAVETLTVNTVRTLLASGQS
jgi:hypothetical protein